MEIIKLNPNKKIQNAIRVLCNNNTNEIRFDHTNNNFNYLLICDGDITDYKSIGNDALNILKGKDDAKNCQEHVFEKEYWIKYYLKMQGERYGIQVVSDLDKESPMKKRGDCKVLYDGEELILEAEKDLSNFYKHNHITNGRKGWDDISSIDIVFAVEDVKNKKASFEIENKIPVILADYSHFSDWYNKVMNIKNAKEALFISLIREMQHRLNFTIFDGAYEYDEYLLIKKIASQLPIMYVYSVLFGSDGGINPEESYDDLADRIWVLFSSSKGFKANDDILCNSCNNRLILLGQGERRFPIDFEADSDGQIADMYAAELSGEFEEGIHGNMIRVFYCTKCSSFFISQY